MSARSPPARSPHVLLDGVAVAYRGRVEDRGEQPHLVEGVLGVLAGPAASGEEGLERLGRELNDAVAVDATRPAAREVAVPRREHAQAHVRSVRSASGACSLCSVPPCDGARRMSATGSHRTRSPEGVLVATKLHVPELRPGLVPRPE